MYEGFAKYSARNFDKRLDKFRSKRVGTVKVRHLDTERPAYDPLKLLRLKSKITCVKIKFKIFCTQKYLPAP